MKHIAIMASGGGSNAEVLSNYFSHHNTIEVSLIICNRKNAGVIDRARRLNIPLELISKDDLADKKVEVLLNKYSIDYIVLAGFLLKIPESLVKLYPNKILNIHPALLPKYGGKGMYGNFVHEAVIKNKEVESGITVHLVNENYDEGSILFQATTYVNENDTPESLANKIHVLEHENYPRVVEKYIESTAT